MSEDKSVSDELSEDEGPAFSFQQLVTCGQLPRG